MLKTARVALTPVTEADLPVMLDWINNREQVLFNAPYKPVGQSQHQQWFEAFQRRTDAVLFAIRLTTGELIGTCQLHSIHPVHRSAELQIRLGNSSEHGKGYGTDAVRLLLRFAFKDLNLRRVYLHVFSTNLAAVRVYEKVGFVREGLLRSAAYINGEYVDVVAMGILQEEYVKQ
ncbi:MAG TPA: GNAT family protein [Pyrinomonadaceae bacterium]|jgi:RimJ/RimL family protein N-acetyltransferase